MAPEMAATRTASMKTYTRILFTDRRPFCRAGELCLPFDSLSLAADIVASLLQEKDDSSWVVRLLAIDTSLP